MAINILELVKGYLTPDVVQKALDNPIGPNDTEEGKAKNRRLELVVEKR